MSKKLLCKGIEVELYAGKASGEIVPISTDLKSELPEVSQEPDQRNFEYITNPTKDYETLRSELILPKIKIRETLKDKFGLTLIPGSTLSLPFEKKFFFSKPEDPYHQYIAKTYGTNVITTSLHLNFGIEDISLLFRLLSALRLDTSLFLTLSAASPFFDGKLTGYQSFRWHNFPKTPEFVPFFKNHDEYIKWSNKMIEEKQMYNVRHLWTSIRPNGIERPLKLNRLELRVCDLVCDTNKILAIICLIELIIQDYMKNEQYPKILNTNNLDELAKKQDEQEELAAKDGLNAKIYSWRTDSYMKISDIVEDLYKKYEPEAKDLGIYKQLIPIADILENGNEATRLINKFNETKSIPTTMQHFTEQFNNIDLTTYNDIKEKIKISN